MGLFSKVKSAGIDVLIESDRYKKSIYKIEIVNGKHALVNTETGKYVDLQSPSYEWKSGTKCWHCCLGDEEMVMDAFMFKNPIIEEIKTRVRL